MKYQSVRQSRPDYAMGLNKGTLGPVARRGWDSLTNRLMALAEKQGSRGLRYFVQTAPLRLLKVLIEVHPMAKMAHSNNAADICQEDGTQIVAVKKVTKRDEETGIEEVVEEIDPEETAELQRFMKMYPGGYRGFSEHSF